MTGHHATEEMRSRSTPGAGAHWREPFAFLDVLEHLRCPVDQRPLRWLEDEDALLSADGARRYPVEDGIACLFAPNEWPEGKSDVSDMVKSFYTKRRRFPTTTTSTGGHVIVFLYNWLGRLPTLWRRAAIETFGENWARLDARLRGSRLNSAKPWWSATACYRGSNRTRRSSSTTNIHSSSIEYCRTGARL